jgi:hypothetical protein
MPTNTDNILLVYRMSRCLPTFQVNLKKDHAIAMAVAQVIIANHYSNEIQTSSISHHVLLRLAAPQTRLHETVSQFMWPKTTILKELVKIYSNHMFIPDVFDELYIMREEFDYIDPEKRHYDGILKLPFIDTARSLTYLSGETAELVAVSSSCRFQTKAGSAIVLDFNRELHYVILRSSSSQQEKPPPPRIMIKSSLHVIPHNTPRFLQLFIIYSHRLLFFVIKTVRNGFERSGNGIERIVLMVLDNLFRTMNNKCHMVLPLAFVAIGLYMLLLAPLLRHPKAFVPYIICIACLCKQKMSALLSWVVFAGASVCSWCNNAHGDGSAMSALVLCLLQHLGWLVVVKWAEINGDMAREVLFAPIPAPIKV